MGKKMNFACYYSTVACLLTEFLNYWNKLLVIILTNKKLLSLDYNTLYSLSYFDAVYSCKFKDTLEKM